MVISEIGFRGIDRPLGINRHAASTGLVAMNSFVASVDLTASTIDYRHLTVFISYGVSSYQLRGEYYTFSAFFLHAPLLIYDPPPLPKN